MSSTLSREGRERLARVSTATITTVLFKRGLRNAFIQDVHPLNPHGRRMVGEAYTLRYMPSREDLDTIEVFQDPEHPQRRAIEECPAGHVMVIDSRKDPRAASAGNILVARLMKRDAGGIVTDGGFRDALEIAQLDFPSYHCRASAPTNLTRHRAVGINEPIGCGDVPVFPGDIMVGDGEGVVCIPAHMAEEVAQEAFEMTAFEDFVAEEVMAGRSIIGLYPATRDETRERYARWRKKNGR